MKHFLAKCINLSPTVGATFYLQICSCIIVLRIKCCLLFLRPVSTQENKDRIGLDSFPSCIIHTAGPKKLKILQLFNIGSYRFKLEQKIATVSPFADSFCSDPVQSHAYFPEWKQAFKHTYNFPHVTST